MILTFKNQDCDLINLNPPITFPYKLDTFQKNAINSIEQGNNVLACAHTGSGKTTIAEYAIALGLSKNKKIIYTSPIKTLSNQKYYDFSKQYESVGILTGDIKQNPDANILIMTTEILRNMLFRNNFIHNPSIGGHPAFTVKNINLIKEKLDNLNILYSDANVYAMPGFHQIYLYDANANTLEINQEV